ncbi:hypothetical protein GGR57DRAFT_506059 [Xylariaceae sp. FL1272]|nr:hypothetical protein GGR57DRAFT_506059 [Xylariaceae sp. FL1272]
MSSLYDSDVTVARNLLAHYFDRDEQRRFELEGLIGGGVDGAAWKVKYRFQGVRPENPNDPDQEIPPQSIGRIVLKTNRGRVERLQKRNLILPQVGLIPPPAQISQQEQRPDQPFPTILDRDNDDIYAEHKVLRALRGAMHIVNDFRPTNDPLGRWHHNVPLHTLDAHEWLYMEFLQNGTFCDFIERASMDSSVTTLPNRLLWKIFLCLLRIFTGMAFPPPIPTGNSQTRQPETIPSGVPAVGYYHDDLHNENLMFGNISVREEEHRLVPILKAIDLGATVELRNAGQRQNADNDAVWDVGTLMYSLIALQEDIMDSNVQPHDGNDEFFKRIRWPTSSQSPRDDKWTCAVALLPDQPNDVPFPGLDDNMRILVCACMFRTRAERPALAEVLAVVEQCSRFGADHYGNRPEEQDDNISRLVQRLIFDPLT